MTAPALNLARWRYHFTDFRTGRFLATLPLTGVSLGGMLSGASDATGSVPLSSEGVRARDPFTATITRRTVMWAERQTLDPDTGEVTDSAVPWAGPVMKRQRRHTSQAMALGMVSWASYFQRRLVPDGAFVQADKFTIMRWLIASAVYQPEVVTDPPGALPVIPPHLVDLTDLSGPLSGVLADRTYLASDLKPVLEAAKELASSGDGFDWRLIPYMAVPYDLTTLRVRLELGYPRLGRVAA